ncbi:MAG: Gfo/Idh/MocA family oxidoreductase [candidate division WOR-3 bacterium]|nr:Gfo/Idh/MocA family oxidoreductase [candidate division WOR-3 bacterium]
MEPVRWGVLGVSRHFLKKVLLPLQKSQLAELYGIASRSREKAEKTAKKYGIPNSFSSYEELLKDENVEAVYIPLPNHLHTPWIKKAAEAGKHILCEKPLALSAKEAKESIDYAENNHVLVMEAFMYRFHPQWQRALELVNLLLHPCI